MHASPLSFLPLLLFHFLPPSPAAFRCILPSPGCRGNGTFCHAICSPPPLCCASLRLCAPWPHFFSSSSSSTLNCSTLLLVSKRTTTPHKQVISLGITPVPSLPSFPDRLFFLSSVFGGSTLTVWLSGSWMIPLGRCSFIRFHSVRLFSGGLFLSFPYALFFPTLFLPLRFQTMLTCERSD